MTAKRVIEGTGSAKGQVEVEGSDSVVLSGSLQRDGSPSAKFSDADLRGGRASFDVVDGQFCSLVVNAVFAAEGKVKVICTVGTSRRTITLNGKPAKTPGYDLEIAIFQIIP